MAQYNRPPRVKAVKSDEFISFFDRLVRYFLIHQKKFYALIGAAALGFAAYGVYVLKAGRDAKNFAMDYWQAEQSPESQASQTWQDVMALHPPGKLPELIRLQWGGDLAKQKQWDEAAKVLQANEKTASLLLRDLSELSRATALENARQWSEAYEIYRSLAENKEAFLKEEARLGMARALSGQGKDQEAEVILLQLLGKESDAPPAVKAAALNRWVSLKVKP